MERGMNSRLEQGSMVTVFGGTGFIGRYAVRALAREGWRVRAAVRRPDLAGYLQPMGAVGQIHAVQANVRYPDSVRRAVEGSDAVVNLVGVLTNSGDQSFEAINVVGADVIAKAAREAGVRTLVHVSAIGASRSSKGLYGRSKAAGENAVTKRFAEAIILRPSVVFGPEDAFFNRFASLARMGPWVPLPLIGGGKTRFQPVFAGDVAAAVAAAAAGRAKPATVYELGGPEVLTFREILDLTQTWSGHRSWYLHLPFTLAKLAALATLPFPGSLRPLTVDQVRMLQQPNVVSPAAVAEERTLAGLGRPSPHAAATIVPTYLERFQPKGQYSHYRG